MPTKPFQREYGSRPSERRTFEIEPDDKRLLEQTVELIRQLPDDVLRGTKEDFINHAQRVAGMMLPIIRRIHVVVERPRRSEIRQRIGARPKVDPKTVAEGVFGKASRRARDEITTVTSRKGRRIPVVRRAEAAGQMRLI